MEFLLVIIILILLFGARNVLSIGQLIIAGIVVFVLGWLLFMFLGDLFRDLCNWNWRELLQDIGLLFGIVVAGFIIYCCSGS